ncbi:hypothetical protein [Dactylosporangium sp. CA-139066]|uniref:hypothetical protein n=1 Tax=Dactylosporangium sp. CA-139066 TaxID=3239930 RepID=UPI003D92AE6E
MTATALITYLDESTITITADTAQGVADLRRFAEAAHLPGESRFVDADIDGTRQSIVIDHGDLAAVRLEAS